MRIALVCLFSTFLLGALGAPVAAQVTTPDEWEGIWEFTNVTRDCDTGAILAESTTTEALCASEVVDFTGDDEFPGECIGSIGPSGGSLTCSGSQALPGGLCTIDFDAVIEVTVSGNSFTSTVTLNTTYEGDFCGPVTDGCVEVTTSGVRVGPVTSECSVPVDDLSWGAAKARY